MCPSFIRDYLIILREFDKNYNNVITQSTEQTITFSNNHAQTEPPVGKQWPQQFRPADEPAKAARPCGSNNKQLYYLCEVIYNYTMTQIIKSFRVWGHISTSSACRNDGELPFSKGSPPVRANNKAVPHRTHVKLLSVRHRLYGQKNSLYSRGSRFSYDPRADIYSGSRSSCRFAPRNAGGYHRPRRCVPFCR